MRDGENQIVQAASLRISNRFFASNPDASELRGTHGAQSTDPSGLRNLPHPDESLDAPTRPPTTSLTSEARPVRSLPGTHSRQRDRRTVCIVAVIDQRSRASQARLDPRGSATEPPK